MNFFRKIEKRLGRFAIPNLMLYLTVLYGIGFAISLVHPMLYFEYLSLDPGAILHGQVWRLITWLMYPPSNSIFFGLIMLVLYYSLGMNLERVWGKFRFNVYMFMGFFFLILAAFLLYALFGKDGTGVPLTPGSLNTSIFLAFAMTYPEMNFYIYFVLPIKAKYLALVYLVMEIYSFITGGLELRITIGLSLLNFLIFFLLTRDWKRFSPQEVARKRKFKEGIKIRPRSFRHKCAVCGRTEMDDENLEFRFCSKCKGNLEYCSDHLYTHIHVE